MEGVGMTVRQEDSEAVLQNLGPVMNRLCGATLLVTGAAGFLCSRLVEAVGRFNESARTQCRVLALDNYKTGSPESLKWARGRADVSAIQASVTDELLGLRPDWIIHGASIASPSFYRKFPLETIDANVGGTRRMLNLAMESKSYGMLLLSSSEVYGDPDAAHIPTAEDYCGSVSFTGPRACYDESKRMGETLAMAYHRLHGQPVKVARPFNVYGPGQRLDDGRIIPSLMRAAVERQPIVLHSDGTDTRSFCYASDAVAQILLILLSPRTSGEAYNVGHAEEVSVNEVADIAANLGETRLEVRHEASVERDYLTDNPKRRCPNLEKVTRLGATWPCVKVGEGLVRTLRSYRENETK